MITQIRNEFLELLPEKAICWRAKKILLLADLHLGKTNHFRRSGIAVSQKPNDHNIERLINIFRQTDPERVIFMGDLFHSHYNAEWEVFGQVLKHFPGISFELILGNHDIMSEYQYLKHQLLLHTHPVLIEPFILSHEPLDEIPQGQYNMAGHIHPGVGLHGKGRQGIRLPCFYFGQQQALLPAFGEFTGLYRIKPQREDQVFVVVEDTIMQVKA